jgi:hypothetical protein
MPKSFALFAVAMLALSTLRPIAAQKLESAGENILRLEGTDPTSGIHYLRLILLLNTPENPAPETQPRFTMECWERHSKGSLHWTVRFDGSNSFDFTPPVESTPDNPNPTPNRNVNLRMRFEGYMNSHDFKREWEVLPSGEFRYRNSGLGSANLDDPRYFMTWLASLPNLRIGFAKQAPNQGKDIVFPLKPLLDLVNKSALCQP